MSAMARVVALRGGNRPGSTVRRVDEPAPTLVLGGRCNAVDWVIGEERIDALQAAYRARRT